MSAVHHKVTRLALVSALAAMLFGAVGVSASTAAVLTPVLVPCTGQTLSQPFLPWLDPSNYELAANGDFESTGAWTLVGGAQMVAGNNSFNVAGAGASRSLLLPSGSSATSGAICIGSLSPTIRLFEINGGSALATLKVEVIYRDIFGVTRTTQVGLLGAGPTWTPTPPILVLANLTALPLLTDGSTTVAFRFTPQGSAGLWRIDDVYVDPYKGS
jgi:hypothetical protein